MKKNLLILMCLIISLLILINYKDKNKNNIISPININKNHICACDSMILIDYNGPKAQIIWTDENRSYYCEVREIFYEVNDKIKSKRIKKIFVQDFSNLEWGSYTDKWIDAEQAVYVIDSNKDGAMGVTYVPFNNIDSAKNFMKENGGILLNFNQINTHVLTSSNEILKKRMIF
ncbi:MAG TPA: nitrous oxide reductase accessory protein NosL [Candidatus Azoamicus sp. MARI]